jgi:Tol biopolymer transport system component
MTRALKLLLACGLLMAGSVAQAEAQTAPQNGRIAFDACNDVGCDIYTANPDGTAVRQVTHDGSSFYADWSPDGKRIAYASFVSGFTAIWIVDAEGTHARQLTPDEPGNDNLWPRFSGDGRTIYYTNCLTAECDGGISSIHPDGSGQRVVTPNSGDSYNIGTPSPDGSRLAFMRWHVNGVKMRVYMKRLTGPSPRPEIALTPPALEGWAPDWAPGGDALLFSSNLFANRPNGALYELTLDGSGHTDQIRQLTHPPFPLEDWAGMYAPRGGRVVFTSDRRYPGRDGADLFVIRRDGGGLRKIAMPPAIDELYVEWPSWGTAPLLPAAATSTARAPRASATGELCANLHGRAVMPRVSCGTRAAA